MAKLTNNCKNFDGTESKMKWEDNYMQSCLLEANKHDCICSESLSQFWLVLFTRFRQDDLK